MDPCGNAQQSGLDNNDPTSTENTIPTEDEEVVTVTAASGGELTVPCAPSASVDDLKLLIADHLKIAPSQVSLLHGCDILDAGKVAEVNGKISFVVKPLDAKVVFDLLKTDTGGNALPFRTMLGGRWGNGIPVGCVFLDHDKLAISVYDADSEEQLCICDIASGSVAPVPQVCDVLQCPTGICYCASTKTIFLAEHENGGVHSFSSTTYEHIDSFRPPGLSHPHGVAVAADGNLLAVTDYKTNSCHVIQVQGPPGTPQQCDSVSSLSSKGDSVRFPFTLHAPSGVAFAHHDLQIVVADTLEQRIVMFDVATLEVLWERPTPIRYDPASLLVAGDKIMVLMQKRNGGWGTKCSIYAHPVYPSEVSTDEWSLLHDNIDNDNHTSHCLSTCGLALWAGSVLAVTTVNAKEVLVFK